MRARSAPVAVCLIAFSALAACSGADRPASGHPVADAVAAPSHVLSAAPPAARTGSRPRVVPGEYLVKFRIPTDAAYAAARIRAASLRLHASFRSVPGLHLVKAEPGASTGAARAALAADPSVEYVEPNYVVHADAVPDDPMFPRQWALHNTGQTGGSSTANPDIGAVAAWDITTGSSDVVVAVIDTGIDYTHVDLAANIFVNPGECAKDGIDHDGNGYVNDCHGINAITGSGDPMDDYFHGTHVAGIIGAAGNNATGVSGVNWNVTLLPCKFLDSSGNGSDATAITCLDYVAAMKDRGVNIIATNNSWGGSNYSRALADAIVAQRQRGILFVTAAGNDSTDNDQLPQYPCSYDLANVICVAATYDSISFQFSNYGRGTVHLGAPGEAILSTVPNNGYDTYDGTSMATPFVTGVLALLKAQDPTRDWRALRNLTLATTVPPTQYSIPTLTGGRVNAANALTCAGSVVEARMRPAIFEPITLAVGAVLRLEALNINCANPNGPVVVTVAETGQSVTLVDDGSGVDEVAGDGIYAGTWTAPAAGTYTLTFPGRAGDVVTVQVDPLLKPGFPVQMLQTPDLNGIVETANVPLVVGHIDADPRLAILAPGGTAGPLYAWKPDGSAAPGWPNYDVGEVVEVSIGALAGDPSGHQIVAAGLYGGVRLYAGDGTPLPGWPQTSANVWYPAPMIDLDGDGRDELILYPARHADGSLVNSTLTIPVMAPNTVQVSGAAAVADLDADGQPDFVVADSVNIYASNAQGILAGFPVATPDHSAGGPLYPVIGDVVGDGTPKIIVPTVTWSNGAGYLVVNILSNRGVVLRSLRTTEAVTNNMVALADLDGDGIPEIIAATGTTVYVWKGDGTPLPGWPVSLGAGTIAGSVAVGDVDGDGYPDVALISGTYINGVAPRAGLVHVYDRHGKPLPGFPRPIKSTITFGTPAVADLDGTGRNQLVVAATPDFGLRDAVYVYDLHGSGPFGPPEWGQYMGGPEHRGYYELGKNLPNDAFLTAQAHGSGSISSGDGAIQCGASCSHRYRKGTTVSLFATAAPGASFSAWFGPCAGQGNPCTVAVNRYTPVAADFASPLAITLTGSGTGTVNSSPSGLACPGTCSVQFPARSTVTLTASAAPGNAFAGWSGACSGLAPTCTVVIDGGKAVQARFVDHWQLTLSYAGTGQARIVSSPAGIDCGTGCSAGFAPATVVTLTATPAGDTYLSDWGVPGCQYYVPTCTLTMNADTSAVVSLAPKPTISVTLNGSGSVQASWWQPPPSMQQNVVKCSANCVIPVDPGVQVEFDVMPASGWSVASLQGDCTATATPCYLTLDSAKVVTVNFAAKPTVTVSVAGSGHGTVTSSDFMLNCAPTCSDAVAAGTMLTLTATPDTNSTFDHWSGACSGSQPTCTLTVNVNTTAGASFTAKPSSGGGGGGGQTGGGGQSGGGGGIDPATLTFLGVLALARRLHGRPHGVPGPGVAARAEPAAILRSSRLRSRHPMIG
jgi:subtilisin family serine protease